MNCLAAADIEHVSSDLAKLYGATDLSFHPGHLGDHRSHSPSRLAVDPHAMADACSIHSGDVAARSGQYEAAQAYFKLVLANSEKDAGTYYISQARSRLDDLEIPLQASMR
jgi:hypothetical protein